MGKDVLAVLADDVLGLPLRDVVLAGDFIKRQSVQPSRFQNLPVAGYETVLLNKALISLRDKSIRL